MGMGGTGPPTNHPSLLHQRPLPFDVGGWEVVEVVKRSDQKLPLPEWVHSGPGHFNNLG